MDRSRDKFRPRRRAETVAGTVTIKPDAKTGRIITAILKAYLCREGRARMRWGEQLQFTRKPARRFHFRAALCAASGDQRQPDEVLECVLLRSDGQAVAINPISSRSKSRKPCCGSIRCTAIPRRRVTQSSGGR